jgi:hypothetical protein
MTGLEILGLVLLIIGIMGLVFCIFLAIRNERVYKFRIKLCNFDYDTYKSLPSYDKMLYSFKSLESFLPKK